LSTKAQRRLTTFSGVFIPSVVTTFGVILFYRTGWVTANAGLIGGLIVIIAANVLTFVTALSLSSIASNIKVEVGGTYYMISRSLGPEIGGAIGIALFFAQAFSTAFYTIGFSIAVNTIFPQVPLIAINFITLTLITIISIIDAEIAIKAQYIILALVLLGIFSFFIGNFRFDVTPQMFGTFEKGSLWITLAIFFPGVSGFDAGISMSGDLKDPYKSIPRGTLWAIGFTFFFYALIAVWFAFNFTPEQVFVNELLMVESAVIPVIVLVGVLASTLSSATGRVLGTPRTLQALAYDGIVPRFLAKGSKKTNEPRIAMIFSCVITGVLLLFGSIDFLAQLLAKIFLATYAIANFICAMEIIVKNPSFRPVFKIHWIIPVLGTIMSVTFMFLIDAFYSIAAIIILAFLYVILARRGLQKNWGDIRKGFWASIIEVALANYERYKEHPRNWRPHIAIFENDMKNRELLANFAVELIGRGNGIISNYIFIDRNVNASKDVFEKEYSEIQRFIEDRNYANIYPEIIFTNKDKNSNLIALQADGIGTFKANTIITDFCIDDKSLETHLEYIKSYDVLKKNIIFIKGNQLNTVCEDRIDVWISGFKSNLSILLLIPVLLSKNIEWSKTSVFFRMIVSSRELKEEAERNISAILEDSRIKADIDVILLENNLELNTLVKKETKNEFLKDALSEKLIEQSPMISKLVRFLAKFEQPKSDEKRKLAIYKTIEAVSRNARLVIMGVNIPAEGKVISYARDLKNLLKGLPVTMLVKGKHTIFAEKETDVKSIDK